ncbi:hypothetical protein BRD17_01580 [Halobacteriales archaeon SW_7_68_16]|nr:MAG: hypothetical protein BRD17_01580 [Halobacteriales archaeon SW_7_68_16]
MRKEQHMSADFYDLLGVSEDASAREIRRAYRDRVRRYHPDRNDDRRAQAQFTAIKKAYEVLGDEENRRRYDEIGHEAYVSKMNGLPSVEAWQGAADADDGATATGDDSSGGISGGDADVSSSVSSSASASTTTGTVESSDDGDPEPATGSRQGGGIDPSSGSSSGSRSDSSGSSTDPSGGRSSSGSASRGTEATAGASAATRSDRSSGGSSGRTENGTATGSGGRTPSPGVTNAGGTSSAERRRTANRRTSNRSSRPVVPAFNLDWLLLFVFGVAYLAGIAGFAGARRPLVDALYGRFLAAGTDIDQLRLLLTDREALPSITEFILTGTRRAIDAGDPTISPDATTAVLLLAGITVLPFTVLFMTRNVRATNVRWNPTYLYAIVTALPLCTFLGSFVADAVPLYADLLFYVAFPTVAIVLLPIMAFFRPLVKRLIVWPLYNLVR